MNPVTRVLSLIAPVLLLTVSSMGQLVGDCGHWDSAIYGGQELAETFDTQWHFTQVGGEHWIDAWRDGTCRYACPPGQCQPNETCIATANATDTPTPGDTGALTVIQAAFPPVPQWHVLSVDNAGGSASNQGSVNADASSAIGVSQCPLGQCAISFKVSVGGVIDFNLSGGFKVWQHPDHFTGFCPMERAYPQTPIIIDVANEGFQLTDAYSGVTTKLVDPGRSIRVAWTKPGSHNAFLYRDGHLFGNSTPQPASAGCPNPALGCGNGFVALRPYDTNGDGVLDSKELSQFQLWTDFNHDGVVQANELSPLPSSYEIYLDYVLDGRADTYGNFFRYKGHIKGAPGVKMYDVELTIDPSQ